MSDMVLVINRLSVIVQRKISGGLENSGVRTLGGAFDGKPPVMGQDCRVTARTPATTPATPTDCGKTSTNLWHVARQKSPV